MRSHQTAPIAAAKLVEHGIEVGSETSVARTAPIIAAARETVFNQPVMERKEMAQTQSEKPPTPATQTSATPPERTQASSKNEQKSSFDTDPIAMLNADHRRVEQLFGSFEKATTSEQKSQLAKQICSELIVHTLLEEEIFYPACQSRIEKRLLEEAQVEHDGAKALIIEIKAGSPDDQYFDAKVKVLSEEIKHHVREEEKPSDGIFAKANEGGIATPDLAKRLAARKQELMEEAEAGALGPPETRSFRVRTNAGTRPASKEHQMARSSSSTRERDERGRFVSDDDDRDYRGRSSGRSRYDDEDDRHPMRSRDEEGRFTSPRSRYNDDDDENRRGGRGHGGWYGDAERHSEASRRGWEERGASRAGYRDDDRRSMRSRDEEGRFTSSRSRYDHDDDDDRHGGRGHGGWYGDAEGHSEASRRGWEERGGERARYRDEDDRRSMRSRDDEGRFTSSRSRYDHDDDSDRRGGRGHGGWYGDPVGHSEASRRGWEERGSYRDDDDDRRHSRSRYDDDHDRRGRGHGGWYGDPEGHSEAARRGRR
jgi:hemerythrin superfamily protein